MKKDDLIEALGFLDDELVEEAIPIHKRAENAQTVNNQTELDYTVHSQVVNNQPESIQTKKAGFNPFSAKEGKYRFGHWFGLFAGAAACLMVLVTLSTLINRQTDLEPDHLIADSSLSEHEGPDEKQEDAFLNLPIIALADTGAASIETQANMGTGGLLWLSGQNPVQNISWQRFSADTLPQTLPCFHKAEEDLNLENTGSDFEKRLKEISGQLGIDENTMILSGTWNEIPEGESDNELYSQMMSDRLLNAENDELILTIRADLSVQVYFKEPLPLFSLQQESNPAQQQESLSQEMIQKAAEEFIEKYGNWLAMENPQVLISGGDAGIERNSNGTEEVTQYYQANIYDQKQDPTESFLSASFDSVVCSFYEQGVNMLTFPSPSWIYRETGAYPLSTMTEAESLLKEGNYLTTVPDTVSELLEQGGEIVQTDLVYAFWSEGSEIIPWYVFYIQNPQPISWIQDPDLSNSIHQVSFYYVPAIQPDFLEELPGGLKEEQDVELE